MLECIKIVSKWCGLNEYLKDYTLLNYLEFFVKFKKPWSLQIRQIPFNINVLSFELFHFKAPLYLYFSQGKYLAFCRIFKYLDILKIYLLLLDHL